MRLSQAHLWLPSILGAIGCGSFVLLHLRTPWIVAGEPTAILVPCLASLVIFMACVVDAAIMIARTRATAQAKVEAKPDSADAKPDLVRLTWYLASLAAFALLMKPLGFILLVAIVFPLLLTFGERIPLGKSLLITFVTGAVVYIVFQRLLAVDLPTGTILAYLF